MNLDDELCLCFHVTQRKVLNFLRVEKPRRVGELSHCQGAGTGCGWCRPFLQRLFDQAIAQGQIAAELPTAADYARLRQNYLSENRGEAAKSRTTSDDRLLRDKSSSTETGSTETGATETGLDAN